MMMIKKTIGLLSFGAAVVLTMPPALAEGDPAVGEQVFRKCKACHEIEKKKNRVGPHLIGVFGRQAGTEEVFGRKYSKAMKEADVVWDEATLDQYLADPKAFIPKNRMIFKGLDEQDRADVIAYLKNVTAK